MADFTVTPTSGKVPLLGVEFDGSRSHDTDGVVSTYAWDFGDGASGTGRTVSHDYDSSGVYIASLVVTDNDGGASQNASTATITVDPNVPPVAVIQANPDVDQYSPSTITFDAGNSTDPDGVIDSYAWDFGDSTTDTGSVVSHTFENAGITPVDFIVTLTVTDDSGFDASDTHTVTVLPVNQDPIAVFTACPIAACPAPDDPPFHAPYTVTFVADASTDIDGSIVQFEWDFGDGNTELKDDPSAADFSTATHEYLTSGTFSVRLTVTDNAGAVDTATADLTIDNLPPIVGFTVQPQQGTAPLTVTFDASASFDSDGMISRYDWEFGDGETGSASTDPDNGMIDQSTVVGVGSGDGVTADHAYSTVSSAISNRSVPVDATSSIAVGNIDGDSLPDVVIGNSQFVNHVFLSTLSPLQAADSTDVADDLDATLAVLLQDIDGDGFADLIVANGIINDDLTLTGQENKAYLWNPLTSSFDSGQPVSADARVSTSIAAAFIDADSNIDLVVGNIGAPNQIFLGTGGGGFAAGTDISADIDDTSAVALEDVDSDGDLDLLVANLTSTNRLYLGDGMGGFLPGRDIGSEILRSTALALDDLDGDGDPDLAIGNSGTDRGAVNRVYLNQCDGACSADTDVFAGDEGTDITPDAEATTSIRLEDVDGDGDSDVIVGNLNDPTRLYLNYRNMNPDFAPPFDGILFAKRIVDNTNCDPDIAADCTCDADNPNEEACATEVVTTGIYLFQDNVSDIVVSDMNSDAGPDIIVAKLDMENVLLLNTCNGACTSRDTNPYVGAFPDKFPTYDVADFAIGDIDGDGDVDMVTATPTDSNQLLLSSQGTAFALTSFVVDSQSDNSRSVALADMDGDGDLDLVVGNAGQVNRYYANTCNGICSPDSNVFSDTAYRYAVSSDLANTGSIAIGDVDGDGDPDLVAGNGVFGNQPNRVFINLCVEAGGCAADANVFDPDPLDPTLVPTFFDIGGALDSRNTQSIRLGDIDLDNDLDLIAGNEDQENVYYQNGCNPTCAAGMNPFTQQGQVIESGETLSTQSVALHDIDNDGDLDIIFGNFGSPNKLVVNDLVAPGNSTFRGGVDIGGDSDSTFSVAVGDVNGDSYADILSGNDGTNRLYHSDNGTFDANSIGIEITSDDERTRVIDVFDVGDSLSDQRPDIVVGNNGSPVRIYYNAGTHIVRLTVTDNAGASSSTTVTVDAQPQ